MASVPVCDKYQEGIPGRVDVFKEPADGWAGALHPAAILTASNVAPGQAGDVGGGSLAMSEGTVAAAGYETQASDPTTYRQVIFIFSEPSGGWSGTVSNQAELTAEPVANMALGSALAVSANTVIASSAPRLGSGMPGAAYVYTMPAGGWRSEQQAAELTAARSVGFSGCCSSVAFASQTVFALGTTEGYSIGSNPRSAVFVFSKRRGGWADTTQSAELTASHPEVTFHSLAAYGDTVAVGAGSGAVYVFIKPAGGWSGKLPESAILTASDGSPFSDVSWPSFTVAVSNRTVFAGAPAATSGTSKGKGAVYVFTEPRTGWSGTLHETAKLTVSDKATTGLGSSLAVSGQMVVATAPGGHGAVYLFRKPAGGWSRTVHETGRLMLPSTLTVGRSLLAGTTVAADGSTILLGAPSALLRPHGPSGAVYLYRKPKRGWVGAITTTATLAESHPVFCYSNSRYGDGFGTSVGVSGDTVMGEASCSVKAASPSAFPVGAAYVFKEPRGGWSGLIHETSRLAPPPDAGPFGANFGGSVAVNHKALIIGAPGANYGAAYVIEQTTTRHWANQ